MKLFKKKRTFDFIYNPAIHKPVIHCSICTSEKIAGFMDRNTNKFIEVLCIKEDKDLEDFKGDYQLNEIERIY